MPQPRLKPRLLHPETGTLTMRPTHLHWEGDLKLVYETFILMVSIVFQLPARGVSNTVNKDSRNKKKLIQLTCFMILLTCNIGIPL